MDRKYAMSRVGTGDWLCPSNDLTEMWRFHTFKDGSVHGLVVDYEERTFWRAVWMPMDAFKRLCADRGEVSGAWATEWTESDWYLPSRAACIEKMLKHEAATLSR